MLGGLLPAFAAALAALLLSTHYFTEPYGHWDVTHRLDVIALVTFILVAVAVSVTVELAARARVTAARERIEAELLDRVSAGTGGGELAARRSRRRYASAFEMTSVALLADGPGGTSRPVGLVGPPLAAPAGDLRGRRRRDAPGR